MCVAVCCIVLQYVLQCVLQYELHVITLRCIACGVCYIVVDCGGLWYSVL